MKSHGIEFTISSKNIQSKDFSWHTDFIFSKAKNEVTELNARSSVMDLVSGYGFARQGYPVKMPGTWFVFHSICRPKFKWYPDV